MSANAIGCKCVGCKCVGCKCVGCKCGGANAMGFKDKVKNAQRPSEVDGQLNMEGMRVAFNPLHTVHIEYESILKTKQSSPISIPCLNEAIIP